VIRSFGDKTPRVAESAFVSEAAYVVGDVVIGENSGIWPGAVVRGDFGRITIGQNTMIEDGTVVHSGQPLEIGDNVIVGHGAVIHGKKIGSYNLIGNNATILDDAEIGSFCVIGAGCVVSPGTKVPDYSVMMGVPGKIKGRIEPERADRLKGGPGSYAVLMRKYKEAGL